VNIPDSGDIFDAPSITATEACLGIPGRVPGSTMGAILIGGSDILPAFIGDTDECMRGNGGILGGLIGSIRTGSLANTGISPEFCLDD
jgi:hypothetical protein